MRNVFFESTILTIDQAMMEGIDTINIYGLITARVELLMISIITRIIFLFIVFFK
jgi:hypothetical protein